MQPDANLQELSILDLVSPTEAVAGLYHERRTPLPQWRPSHWHRQKDALGGKGGDDEIHGLGDSDAIDGGGGNDVIYGGPGGDESLTGDDGDDVIYGGGGNDFLSGWGGEDVLYGGDGNDALNGLDEGLKDTQRDELYCGPGKDVYDAGKFDYVDSSCEEKVKVICCFGLGVGDGVTVSWRVPIAPVQSGQDRRRAST
jgi:Ca2+-binding RTX toxin-like protein